MMTVTFELTEDDKQVIKYLFLSKKLKEIAAILKMKQATVKRILSALYIKLGIADRVSLILWALKNGFNFDHENARVYFNKELI